MRFIFTALLSFLVINVFGQITIDNTTYSTTQLVDGVLISNGSGTAVSNVQYQGVYNSSNRYQVGYFSTAGTTNTQMGFASGVVLSTGNTVGIPLTLGVHPGSVSQLSTGYTSCTTGEVRESGTCPTIINDLNVLVGSVNYFNASILEFDFVPVSNTVSFRYIFASEEYKDNSGFINYQCSSYNDKFGFLISGPGISGGEGYTNDARNIARLANGSEVGINSVNDGIVGSSGGAPSASNCSGENPNWIQNVSTSEFLGLIDGTQFNGNTIILVAEQSGLTPGQTYHIKLMIADANDTGYDSAVYIEEASFVTTAPCTPPSTPTGSVTAQPSCLTATGEITITAPVGADYQYSINGTTYQTGTVFSGLSPATYSVTVQQISTGCVSSGLSLTVDPAPSSPSAPTGSVTAQPSCLTATGEITITAPVGADYQYSINGTTYQAGTVFSGLSPATYSVTVQQISTGCVSSGLSLTVDPAPSSPSAPTGSVTAQPSCLTATGEITITAPVGADYQYSNNGTTYQAGTVFSGLSPATYSVSVQQISTGCVSSGLSLTVDPAPLSEQITIVSDLTIGQGDSATLTATGIGNIVWSTNETSETIIVQPIVSTTYCAVLTDVNGCTDEECVSVIVTEDCGELFVPTAFSPNEDGNNDYFKVKINPSCVQEMNLRVFDRWGELVFETDRIDQYWDGKYKGKELDPAVFAYLLIIKISGNEQEILQKGNVTLLK